MYKTGVPRIISKFRLRGVNHYVPLRFKNLGDVDIIMKYNTRLNRAEWIVHENSEIFHADSEIIQFD